MRGTLRERFDAKVAVSVNDDCWWWTGAAHSNGYGKIGLGGRKGRTGLAHRISFELFNGPIPDGMQVLHRCDNRACVNPDHLFLGSQLDNMRDMVAKGRHPHGLANASARYPDDVVADTVARIGRGDVSIRAAASALGMNPVSVWQWVHGHTRTGAVRANTAKPIFANCTGTGPNGSVRYFQD